MFRLLGRIQPLEVAGGSRHACTQGSLWHCSQKSAIKPTLARGYVANPKSLPVSQQHIRTSTTQQLSTAQHSVLYQLQGPTHQQVQSHQTDHHHAAKVVERDHTLSLPHDTDTNSRQREEAAAITHIKQRVTNQLFPTHTSALLPVLKHAPCTGGIANQGISGGLEQASTRQVPAG